MANRKLEQNPQLRGAILSMLKAGLNTHAISALIGGLVNEKTIARQAEREKTAGNPELQDAIENGKGVATSAALSYLWANAKGGKERSIEFLLSRVLRAVGPEHLDITSGGEKISLGQARNEIAADIAKEGEAKKSTQEDVEEAVI